MRRALIVGCWPFSMLMLAWPFFFRIRGDETVRGYALVLFIGFLITFPLYNFAARGDSVFFVAFILEGWALLGMFSFYGLMHLLNPLDSSHPATFIPLLILSLVHLASLLWLAWAVAQWRARRYTADEKKLVQFTFGPLGLINVVPYVLWLADLYVKRS